jgi:ketosteroid isomerase-like protein
MTIHIAKQPRDIAHCVSAYLQAGDLDGITTLFHPDCKIFFPPNEPPSVGTTGARQAFQAFIEIKPQIRSEVISEIIVDDIALLSAAWTVVAPDGSILASGTSTEVAKKLDNGGWGYLIDCPTGAPPLITE